MPSVLGVIEVGPRAKLDVVGGIGDRGPDLVALADDDVGDSEKFGSEEGVIPVENPAAVKAEMDMDP